MNVEEWLHMELNEDRVYPNMSRILSFKDTTKYKPPSDVTYSPGVLVGEWREPLNSVQHLCKGEKLESYSSHNYKTTYHKAYNCNPIVPFPKGLKNFVSYPSQRKWVAYPGHQPEMNRRLLPPEEWISVYKNDFTPIPFKCKICPDKK